MPITVTRTAKVTRILIDGEFTIYTAAESAQALQKALQKQPPFTVDLSAIEEIDTSGVQLLLQLQRDARKLDKPLSVTAISAAVQDVFTLLDLPPLAADGTGAETAA